MGPPYTHLACCHCGVAYVLYLGCGAVGGGGEMKVDVLMEGGGFRWIMVN